MSSVLIDQHSISCSTGTCPRGRAACCRAETQRATRAARRATTPARPSPPPPSSPSSVSTALCCGVYCVYVCVSECVCNSAHHTCDLSRNDVFGALAGRPHVRLLHIRSIMHIIDIFWRVLLFLLVLFVFLDSQRRIQILVGWLVGQLCVNRLLLLSYLFIEYFIILFTFQMNLKT